MLELRNDQVHALTAAVRAGYADAVLGDLLRQGLEAERESWIDQAELQSPWALLRAVRRRRAEIRCGEEVLDVTVHVPESVADGFERARVIASRKAGRVLDRSQTFEAVVDHYLDSFDPLRKEDGTRRVGPDLTRQGGLHTNDWHVAHMISPKNVVPSSVMPSYEDPEQEPPKYPDCRTYPRILSMPAEPQMRRAIRMRLLVISKRFSASG